MAGLSWLKEPGYGIACQFTYLTKATCRAWSKSSKTSTTGAEGVFRLTQVGSSTREHCRVSHLVLRFAEKELDSEIG